MGHARLRLIPIAVLVVVRGATAHADDPDRVEAIAADDDHWRIELVQLRTAFLVQDGAGYQSQDGPVTGPGSEQMWVLSTAARIRVRQSPRVVHDVTLPVDVISAASPDAVDATTSASRHDESGDLDLRTSVRATATDTVTLRLTGHVEEQLHGRLAGVGWRRSLADDNATIAVTGSIGYDTFDDVDYQGRYHGPAFRWTANANLAASQLLSPTTIVDASYGITQQTGKLSAGWTSVPVPGGVADERLPRARVRQAFAAGVAQHVPATRSTAKLRYRLYVDNFGVTAHTLAANLYQYVTRRRYLRAGYRFHHQTGVGFFTTMYLGSPLDDALRTADSDLAPLAAHEWSLAIVQLPAPGGTWTVSGELLRYARTNDLAITAVAVGLSRAL